MRIPKLRKGSDGRAFVEHKSIPNKSHRLVLGKFGTGAANRAYKAFVRSITSEADEPPPAPLVLPTVGQVAEQYLNHAKTYYRESGEYRNAVDALTPLLESYDDVPAAQFGPMLLTELRDDLIAADVLCRTTINARIRRLRRMFKWAVSKELIPVSVFEALKSVEGLREGMGNVRESDKVGPVPMETVTATLPFLAPTVAAMVQVQRLCGMRPGEVVRMRPADVDRSMGIWLYRPAVHKNQWRGTTLVKAIPRAAQSILEPFLDRSSEAWAFNPMEARDWLAMRRRNPNRKCPIYPSELRRREKQRRKSHGKQPPEGRRFSTASYYRSIINAIERAKDAGVEVPQWHPNQLRHSISTEISRRIGQQAAQRWLGHARLDTTAIYTEKEVIELVEIAESLDRHWEAE